MKILLTGGGTGGHFYPVIAVAEAINKITKEEKILPPNLYYMAPTPYDERALFENNIEFLAAPAGKIRRYFSPLNFFDLFKTALGVIKATFSIFRIFPDVVFGKGAYASFPALVAARLLGIPVIIHESDTKPGRVNNWAGKFAKKIAVSYPQAAEYFPTGKVAHTGNPVREEIKHTSSEGAREFLKLESGTPIILILGGSQGAQQINETLVEILPTLVEKYQIIHQTGEKLFNTTKETAGVVLEKSAHKDRYKPFPYLNVLALRMAVSVTDLIISRAGSTLFEIAIWGKPSIIIPIGEDISHDQTKNAYSYARSGAAVVIEERNLTPTLFTAEIDKLLANKDLLAKMGEKAKGQGKPDAAEKIAREILAIALSHER